MSIATFLLIVGVLGIVYVTYTQWAAEEKISAKSVSKSFVEKTIGQLSALILLINGLDFLPNVSFLDSLNEILVFLSGNLDSGWNAAAQLISLATALYQLVFKNAQEAVTNGFVRVAKLKRVGAKSKVSVLDYAQKLAA